MTEYEKQVLDLYCSNEISLEKFRAVFPIDLEANAVACETAAVVVIATGDANKLDRFVTLLFSFEDLALHVHVLNVLLVTPHHFYHQAVAKALQSIASPTTVPYVKKVLEKGFEFLAYTFSESEVIGKWLSWLLYAIGTPEAISVMREYAESEDEGLAAAMQYRLAKVEAQGA